MADTGPAEGARNRASEIQQPIVELTALTLRRHDIRSSQERPATLALSSLGHAGSHVPNVLDSGLAALLELSHTQPAHAPVS